MPNPTTDLNSGVQAPGSPAKAPQESLWSVRQAAGYLGLHEKTVYDMVAAGRLPVVRMGRLLRFDPRDILRWVSARKEVLPSPERLAALVGCTVAGDSEGNGTAPSGEQDGTEGGADAPA